MFDAQIKAVGQKFVNKVGVIALIGGTRDEQEAWATAHLPEGAHALFCRPVEGGTTAADQIFTHLHQVMAHTLAGAVIFDPQFFDQLLTRPLYLMLTPLAKFMDCKPSELVQHDYEIVT